MLITGIPAVLLMIYCSLVIPTGTLYMTWFDKKRAAHFEKQSTLKIVWDIMWAIYLSDPVTKIVIKTFNFVTEVVIFLFAMLMTFVAAVFILITMPYDHWQGHSSWKWPLKIREKYRNYKMEVESTISAILILLLFFFWWLFIISKVSKLHPRIARWQQQVEEDLNEIFG